MTTSERFYNFSRSDKIKRMLSFLSEIELSSNFNRQKISHSDEAFF